MVEGNESGFVEQCFANKMMGLAGEEESQHMDLKTTVLPWKCHSEGKHIPTLLPKQLQSQKTECVLERVGNGDLSSASNVFSTHGGKGAEKNIKYPLEVSETLSPSGLPLSSVASVGHIGGIRTKGGEI